MQLVTGIIELPFPTQPQDNSYDWYQSYPL